MAIMRLMAWGDSAISEIWFVLRGSFSFISLSKREIESAVSCHLVPLVRVGWRAESNFGASWLRHEVVSIREMDVSDSNEQNLFWRCASQGCSCFSPPPDSDAMAAQI